MDTKDVILALTPSYLCYEPRKWHIKQADGSIKSLTPRQVADLLGHTTSEITELYYVKRDMTKLNGVTDGFEL